MQHKPMNIYETRKATDMVFCLKTSTSFIMKIQNCINNKVMIL